MMYVKRDVEARYDERRRSTLLFPATSIDPSEATVTERIGTSASGTWERQNGRQPKRALERKRRIRLSLPCSKKAEIGKGGNWYKERDEQVHDSCYSPPDPRP